MVNFVKELFKPSKEGFIHYHFTNEKAEIRYVIGAYKKDFFEIKNSGASLSKLQNEIKKNFPTIPFSIAITGDSVITKVVQKDSQELRQWNQREGLICNQSMINGMVFMGIIRDQDLNKIKQEIECAKVVIKDIFIGKNSFIKLLEFHPDVDLRIIPPYKLSADYRSFEIVGMDVDEKKVHAFNSSFDTQETLVRLSLLNTVSLQNEGIIGSKNNSWKYSVAFKKLLAISTVFLFLFSLLGFFIHNHSSNELNSINAKLINLKTKQKRAIEKGKEIKQAKRLLGTLGEPHRYSLYLTQFLTLVPREIQLVTLDLNPLKNSTFDYSEPLVFEDNYWLATGIAKNSFILNQWIIDMEQIPWMKRIKIESFEKIEKEDSFKFELIFQLNKEASARKT